MTEHKMHNHHSYGDRVHRDHYKMDEHKAEPRHQPDEKARDHHAHHQMDGHEAKPHHAPESKAHDHHAHHVEDFRKRFWISLALTVPILALSHMFWELFGLRALRSKR